MEMRVKADTPIGQDLTPPIPPIALSLHHSTLLSHCSSCFSALPPSPSPSPPTNPNDIHYCSSQCSSLDSPLHFSSSEFHFLHLFPPPLFTITFPTSSDLRLSLRLLHRFQDPNGSFLNLERICGLVTNFEKVMFLNEHCDDQSRMQKFLYAPGDDDDDQELSGRIRDGAKAMAVAKRMRDGLDTNAELSAEEYAVEAAVLCLVLTNSVDVQDKDGRSIGLGVYDVPFSWVNHSCSPNASYRFGTSLDSGGNSEFKICPAATETESTSDGDAQKYMSVIGNEACGPRIVLRSIKNIQKCEEVVITYTDLLQPKVMRQSDLWSKYRFSCCCTRCKAMPTSYIDHCLQEILCLNLNCSNMASNDDFDGDHVMEKLVDCLNDAIDDFLSFSNPKSCCEKLEILLAQDHVNVVQKPNGEILHRLFRLYPLHHVSLNAYMALASAYKVYGSDLLNVDHESHEVHQTEAFSMIRKSAAYSLLLAGATHHLFESESCLIAPVSNFWTTAGETLLNFVKSSVWSFFSKGRHSSFSSCQICDKCTLLDWFRDASTHSHDQNADFTEITSQFLNCVSNITPQIWLFLIGGGGYLKVVEDPINFWWLGSWKSSSLKDLATHAACPETKQTDSEVEMSQHCSTTRVKLFQLSIHCLLYGAFLSTVCFGPHSQLMSKVESLLSREGIRNG